MDPVLTRIMTTPASITDLKPIDLTNSTLQIWNGSDIINDSTSGLSDPTQNSIKELLYNGTGYYIEDENESGLNDIETVFLACIATLVPLIIFLFAGFGIKILWNKYKLRTEDVQYDGIVHRDGTTESIARPLHSHLMNDKSEDSYLAISEVETCETPVNNGQITNHSTTNGSIITMTMKNNHLIVETEERNDIEEETRETTMKYSPSARNGVFVVEVSQGVRRSPGSGSIKNDITVSNNTTQTSDQYALVHNPPKKFNQSLSEEFKECQTTETFSPINVTPRPFQKQILTGLASSDTSLSSNHQSYTYTNQQGYETGSYGYNNQPGYKTNDPIKLLLEDNKPKIKSAILKKNVLAGANLENNDLGIKVDNLGGKNDADEDLLEQKRLGNSNSVNLRPKSPKEQDTWSDASDKKYLDES